MQESLNVPTSSNTPSSSSATMSLADNLPTLALSDIMHHMSPSPVPLEEHNPETEQIGSLRERAASPEPLSEADVLGIRRRLEEMGLLVARRQIGTERNASSTSQLSNLSSREKELVDMVLRLTDQLPIDPAQLDRQADVIASLTAQRDFIVRQSEEERERWRSERETWERTAEALLSQKAKPKSEDAGRQREIYESETRALRDKLQETQRRLSSLESELLRLKPLLLMQPQSASRHGPHTQDKGKGREVDSRGNLGSIPEGREINGAANKSQYPRGQSYNPLPKTTVQPPTTSSSSKASTSQAPPQASSHQRRRSRDPNNASKPHSKRHNNHKSASLSSDAYTEHLLLAARKIGRTRATQVSGFMQHIEREKEILAKEQEQIRVQREQEKLERERLERLASGTSGMAYYRSNVDSSPHRGGAPRAGSSALPKTPKKTIHYGPSTTSGNTVNTPIVFVHTLSPPGPVPQFSTSHFSTPGPLASAPNIGNGRGNQQKPLPSNPPTPLDSLLDAARMMDGDGGGSKARGKTNGKGRPLEEPESPVPKRRKISSTVNKPAPGGRVNFNGGGPAPAVARPDRVKSALDVLADQAAAAFDEPEHSGRRASMAAAAAAAASSSSAKRKGKAKETEKEKLDNVPGSDQEENGTDNDSADEVGMVTRESAAVSSRGRGRSRLLASSAKSKARAGSTSASTTGRPVRQASRKQATSPDRGTTATTSTSTRGSSKPRGRPRGSISKPRPSATSEPGISRVISPPQPQLRVIAPPPGYSSYSTARDEVAVQSPGAQPKDAQAENVDASRREERVHQQRTTLPLLETRSSMDLRPVTSWSHRETAGNGAALIESDSSSPINGHVSGLDTRRQERGEARPKDGDDVAAKQKTAATEHTTRVDTPTVLPSAPVTHSLNLDATPIEQEPSMDAMVIESSTRSQTNGLICSASPTPSLHAIAEVEMKSPTPDDDADADAEADLDEDQDAEGEQEDDEEEEADTRNDPFRSKSPPPDPPPPGSDSGPPPDANDEHDADADAEGEMEFEENEDAPSSSTTSGAHQAMKGSPALACEPLSSGPSPLSVDHLLVLPLHADNRVSSIATLLPTSHVSLRREHLRAPDQSPSTLRLELYSLPVSGPCCVRHSLLLPAAVPSAKSDAADLVTYHSALIDTAAERGKLHDSQKTMPQFTSAQRRPRLFPVKWGKEDLFVQAHAAKQTQIPNDSFCVPILRIEPTWRSMVDLAIDATRAENRFIMPAIASLHLEPLPLLSTPSSGLRNADTPQH
ncbi:hypothetical protein BDZ97DRAFT_2073535 [Flammula alnicola]|nr:hypothetical protein BDZ97DRAFT_2073535 [Flammula alnicola]